MAGRTPEQLGLAPNQTSFLRRVFQEPADRAADKIVAIHPKANPDHVSYGGTILGLAGIAVLAAENDRNQRGLPRRPVVLFAGFGLTAAGIIGGDTGDGAIARARERVQPGERDRAKGDRVDYKNDRGQEEIAAVIRAIIARRRGSRRGELAAHLTEVTTTSPSIVKHHRKRKEGVVLPEDGKNVLAKLGARHGRVGIILVGSLFHEIQPWADAAGAIANAYSTYERSRLEGPNEYTDEERSNAGKTEAIGVGIGLASAVHVIYSHARRNDTTTGLVLTGSAIIPLAMALGERGIITTDRLQGLQRLVVPHKKWRKSQPDYRDAMRNLSLQVDGAEGPGVRKAVTEVYSALDSEATRIREAIGNQEYRDKVAVVTGATGAIGREMVKQMALLGADVVMGARDTEKAEAIRQEILQDKRIAPEKIHIQQIDLANQDSVVHAVKKLKHDFEGGIDLLINNAGYTPAKYEEGGETPVSIADVNYLGPTILTMGLLPHLKEGGQVVDITSSSQKGHAEDFEEDHLPTAGSKPKKKELKRVYYDLKLATEAFRNALIADLEEQGDVRGIRFVAFHPGNVHKTLEGRSIKSRASRNPVIEPLLATAGEAALGVVRVLLTTEGNGKYVYGKSVDFPDDALEPDFQGHVVTATEGLLKSGSRELVGDQLQRLKA